MLTHLDTAIAVARSLEMETGDQLYRVVIPASEVTKRQPEAEAQMMCWHDDGTRSWKPVPDDTVIDRA